MTYPSLPPSLPLLVLKRVQNKFNTVIDKKQIRLHICLIDFPLIELCLIFLLFLLFQNTANSETFTGMVVDPVTDFHSLCCIPYFLDAPYRAGRICTKLIMF